MKTLLFLVRISLFVIAISCASNDRMGTHLRSTHFAPDWFVSPTYTDTTITFIAAAQSTTPTRARQNMMSTVFADISSAMISHSDSLFAAFYAECGYEYHVEGCCGNTIRYFTIPNDRSAAEKHPVYLPNDLFQRAHVSLNDYSTTAFHTAEETGLTTGWLKIDLPKSAYLRVMEHLLCAHITQDCPSLYPFHSLLESAFHTAKYHSEQHPS